MTPKPRWRLNATLPVYWFYLAGLDRILNRKLHRAWFKHKGMVYIYQQVQP